MDLARHPLLRPRVPLWCPDGESGGNGTGEPSGSRDTATTTPAPEFTPAVTTTAAPVSPTTFSQEEVNRLVAKARDDGRRSAQDEAKRRAAEEEAARKGEWEKLATDRQTEIDRLAAQLAARDRDLLVAQVAAKHRLPPAIAERLKGETAEDLDADAKALAKIVAVTAAPDNETGTRDGGAHPKGDRPAARPRVEGPLYAFDGTTRKVPWPPS